MNIQDLYEKIDLRQIEEWLSEKKEENLFLDFKTITRPDLSARDDLKTFAKALSGFANSSGGVVIWGIDARKNADGVDCASDKVEIENLPLFLSRLNSLTGDLVDPIVEGVLHKGISTQNEQGFAITLIPSSDSGPHMAKGREDRYYKRSGDSFYKMEHYDIADMFGRRKRPKLSISKKIIKYGGGTSGGRAYNNLKIIIGIENTGRASASGPFLGVRVKPSCSASQYGVRGSGDFGLKKLVSASGEEKYGGSADVVIHPGTIHEVTAIRVKLEKDKSSVEDIEIDYELTASETQLTKGKLVISGKELLRYV